MTDQQIPDLDAAITNTAAHIRGALGPLAEGLREAWNTLRPVVHAAARNAETQTAAHYALAGAFEEDDVAVREQLDGLDAEQLRDVHAAAALVAEHATALHAALTTIPAEETEPR